MHCYLYNEPHLHLPLNVKYITRCDSVYLNVAPVIKLYGSLAVKESGKTVTKVGKVAKFNIRLYIMSEGKRKHIFVSGKDENCLKLYIKRLRPVVVPAPGVGELLLKLHVGVGLQGGRPVQRLAPMHPRLNTTQAQLGQHNDFFHRLCPLGRVSHRVAMSVCMCVCVSQKM